MTRLQRSESAESDPGSLYRTVGTCSLGAAGVVHAGLGVALLLLGWTNWLVHWSFVQGQRYVTGHTIVRMAEPIATVATTGAILLGLLCVAVGVATVWGALVAGRDEGSTWWIPTSLGALLNPLAAPLGVVGATLFWLDHRSRRTSIDEP